MYKKTRHPTHSRGFLVTAGTDELPELLAAATSKTVSFNYKLCLTDDIKFIKISKSIISL